LVYNRSMNTKVLCILDGFGLAPLSKNNIFNPENAPFLYSLFKKYPWIMLDADGESVGQESGLVGNSEVGHMNLGGLQLVNQLSYEITHSAALNYSSKLGSQVLAPNNILKQHNSHTIHLIGLFSSGTIHSDLRHWKGSINASIEAGIQNIVLHLLSDGRDSDRQSFYTTFESFYQENENIFLNTKIKIKLGSISGRFFGMDRDKNFERTDKFIDCLFEKSNDSYNTFSIKDLIKNYSQNQYQKQCFDETIVPKNFGENINKNDSIWLINFRSDRMKQMVTNLVQKNKKLKLNLLIISNNDYGVQSLSSYDYSNYKNINEYYFPLFRKDSIQNTVADYISKHNKTCLHIAETEKFAHVTYFFNGGRQESKPNEKYILIDSNKVDSHAEKPEMKAGEITDYIIESGLGEYDYIVVNYANTDMVAHTGDIDASTRSLKFLDGQLSKLFSKINDGKHSLILTADHGNLECVGEYLPNKIDTEHNPNPVPCIFINERYSINKINENINKIILENKLINVSNNELNTVLNNAKNNQNNFDIWFDNFDRNLPLWYAGLFLLSI
jgi:2,3-bisphosphoglycerate-independent phosphoglycerate mutase